MIKTCEWCSEEYLAKTKPQRFCSNMCSHESMKKWFVCITCKMLGRGGRVTRSKHMYCSRSCSNAAWSFPAGTERITKNGVGGVTIKIKQPNGSWRSKLALIKESMHLSKRHEVIFLDGNKRNLSIENLLFPQQSAVVIQCPICDKFLQITTKQLEVRKTTLCFGCMQRFRVFKGLSIPEIYLKEATK